MLCSHLCRLHSEAGNERCGLFYANVGEEIKLLSVRVDQALAGNPIQIQGNLNLAPVADNNKRIKNLETKVLASKESVFNLDD